MTFVPLFVAALLGIGVEETRVTHSELGFTLIVPDGFVDDAELLLQPDVVFGWYEPRSEYEGTIVLAVQRLRYTLGRDRPSAADLPDPAMELVTFRWRGFDLDGVKAITEEGEVVTFLIQVPLRREAIQLIVSAPIDETDRARALATSMLASLDGETNWLTSTERAERLGETAGRLLLIPLVIGLIVWRRRKQRATLAQATAR
ncbi:MAG TPA: hypothetical protein VMM18_17420 [Gemmatimonadaceae bacterium]|nr:hypothetical protein [Gemmatimonadaceae bacterium]